MAALLKSRQESDFFMCIQEVDFATANKIAYTRCCVGCLILTQAGEILLQQRDDDCLRYPGCLATFGGGIELGEQPVQSVIRELREELGARVNEAGLVSLGAITTAAADHAELVYAYFWHDTYGTITGCYEGKAMRYDDYISALKHPKIMADVCWLLYECQNRQLM